MAVASMRPWLPGEDQTLVGRRCSSSWAALFCPPIESAELCGVAPLAYLREAKLRVIRNPGTAALARDLKSPET
jgi:hypothetical protein